MGNSAVIIWLMRTRDNAILTGLTFTFELQGGFPMRVTHGSGIAESEGARVSEGAVRQRTARQLLTTHGLYLLQWDLCL